MARKIKTPAGNRGLSKNVQLTGDTQEKSNVSRGISQAITGFILSLLTEILFWLNWPDWKFVHHWVDRLTVFQEGGHE